jgi:hypothetical protein
MKKTLLCLILLSLKESNTFPANGIIKNGTVSSCQLNLSNNNNNNSNDSKLICWPKCCFADQIFNVDTLTCESANNSVILNKPEIFSIHIENSSGNVSFELSLNDKVLPMFTDSYALHLNERVCPKKLRYLDGDEMVKLLSDGRLLIEDGANSDIYEEGFCLENFYSSDSEELFISGFICKNANATMKFSSDSENTGIEAVMEQNRLIYTILGFISLVFLSLTMFLYLTLPELSNFQGHITCFYISSNILTTVLLIVSYNMSLDIEDDESKNLITITEQACKLLGYLLYFSGLLMFCWMAVLSFDLFWTFAFTSLPLKNMETTHRYVAYLLFGFGAPSVMALLIFLLDVLQLGYILPGVGEERCFLSFSGARYFFYLPTFIILCFNLFMFIFTLLSLCKGSKDNHIATQSRLKSSSAATPKIEVT